MAHWTWKNPLDFGGDSYLGTLGLALSYRIGVTVDVSRHIRCYVTVKQHMQGGGDLFFSSPSDDTIDCCSPV